MKNKRSIYQEFRKVKLETKALTKTRIIRLEKIL